MGFDSKIDIPLEAPRVHSKRSATFIYQGKKPDDAEFMLERDFQSAEQTRMAMPVSFPKAYRVLETLAERAERLIDHMRWTILVHGKLNVVDPGRDDITIHFPHEEVEIDNYDEMSNVAARLSEECEETGITSYIMSNSTTAENLRAQFFYRDGQPRVIWERHDGGYNEGDNIIQNIPDGVIVVIPMAPPLIGMKATAPKAKMMLARDEHWGLKYEQLVNFWVPEDAPVVTTYKYVSS